jgi:hypothetical protein
MIYHFVGLNPIIFLLSNYYGNYLKKSKHDIIVYNDLPFFVRKFFCVRKHDLYTAVVPDDDHGRISEEEEPQHLRSHTPPTPPDRLQPTPSPPRPIRQRAMAQLRPVSIPNIVSDIAGPDPLRRIADLDRHYMPDGQPAADASW